MDIKQQIREFIKETLLLGADDIDLKDDVSLLEEGVVDSTGVLELVYFVEDTFGFKVPDSDVVPDNFDSVNSLAGYVERMRS